MSDCETGMSIRRFNDASPDCAVKMIAAAVARIVEKRGYNVSRVYLFGSFSRGEATESSDIDLCLETDPGFTLFHAGGIGYCLEEELDREVDIVAEDSLFPSVRESMLRDRILIYEHA